MSLVASPVESGASTLPAEPVGDYVLGGGGLDGPNAEGSMLMAMVFGFLSLARSSSCAAKR